MNLPQETLGIPIDIQTIVHPIIIQGLVKDIKKVVDFTQGMETMYIPPHTEEEDITVQLVPAAVFLQMMNHQIQIHSILQMTVSISLDQVLMTFTFYLKDIVINHT